MDKPTNPLDALIPVIAKTVTDWQTINTSESFSKAIHALLDKNSKEITMKLLGFNSNYEGKWELDHCNGRSGNSAAGEYMRQVQSDAIKEWLSTVQLPEMSAKLTSSMAANIKREYEYALAEKVRELVLEKADSDAKDLVDAVTVSNHIGDYLKLMSLINPESNKES